MVDEFKVLEKFLTPERIRRLDVVLSNRTRNLVMVLEDIYDPHNASACLRSAEAMGLQEVHVIARKHKFRPAPKVTNGADKWLDIFRYDNVADCIAHLRGRGFKVACTSFAPEARPMHELDFSNPLAVVFGNEHDGVSEDILKSSDELFYIPMLGFSQSFNISVAVAIAIYYGVGERVGHFGANGDLTSLEKEELRRRWVKLSVPMAEEILDRVRQASAEATEEMDAGEVETTVTEEQYREDD